MNSAIRVPIGLLLPMLLLTLLTVELIQSQPTTAKCQLPPKDPGRCGCNTVSQFLSGPDQGKGDWIQVDDMILPTPKAPEAGSRPPGTASDFGFLEKPENTIRLWPGGIIFYTIDKSFGPSFENLIRTVLKTLESRVGKDHIEMREAVTKSGKVCRKNRIHFVPIMEDTCEAFVGMHLAGPTEIRLNETLCNQEYIVMHELLHAIGRMHEHMRTGRDRYVIIDYTKVNTPHCSNFLIPPAGTFDPAVILPYDYESIMHYPSCAGSCNGDYVMTTTDGKPIGINRNLTALDVLKIRYIYPTGNKAENGPSLCQDGDEPEQPVVTRVIRRERTDTKKCAGGTDCSGSLARPWRLRELAAVAMGTVLLCVY